MIRSVAEVAATIEHTLLKPETTTAQIDALCDQAIEHFFGGVCLNPIFVDMARKRIDAAGRGSHRPRLVCVVGFPLGATATAIKVEEARRAIGEGADDIDMVVHLGTLVTGDRKAVRADIEALACAVHQSGDGRMLKVILETGALAPEQIILGCRCAAEGEADYVKTSTGFHASGGATVEHVRLLHKHLAPIRVKASGGIRTAAQALAMLDAGASKLGTSAGIAILRELIGG